MIERLVKIIHDNQRSVGYLITKHTNILASSNHHHKSQENHHGSGQVGQLLREYLRTIILGESGISRHERPRIFHHYDDTSE